MLSHLLFPSPGNRFDRVTMERWSYKYVLEFPSTVSASGEAFRRRGLRESNLCRSSGMDEIPESVFESFTFSIISFCDVGSFSSDMPAGRWVLLAVFVKQQESYVCGFTSLHRPYPSITILLRKWLPFCCESSAVMPTCCGSRLLGGNCGLMYSSMSSKVCGATICARAALWSRGLDEAMLRPETSLVRAIQDVNTKEFQNFGKWASQSISLAWRHSVAVRTFSWKTRRHVGTRHRRHSASSALLAGRVDRWTQSQWCPSKTQTRFCPCAKGIKWSIAWGLFLKLWLSPTAGRGGLD